MMLNKTYMLTIFVEYEDMTQTTCHLYMTNVSRFSAAPCTIAT